VYVFFDTETTGLPQDYKAPSSAVDNWPRMVQLSWITTDKDGTIINENDHIIYPDGFAIPLNASSVNGITTQIAKEKGEPIRDVLSSFLRDVNNAEFIVGHNISYDKHIVGAELIRLGEKDMLASKPSICTMESSTSFCAIQGHFGYKYPKLQELYKKLFGYEFEDAHNALSDVKATLKCYLELKAKGIITN
jgi:DNA polymerase III epsilon subunit-like protein